MLTIELNPELEAQLRAEAARTGVDASALVALALEERLLPKPHRRHSASLLSVEEATLLQKINEGLPESIWQEYHLLIARRQAETLTSQEHERLIALSDRIEATHAERMAYMVELAGCWHMSLKELMRRLGIKPRKIENAS